MKRKNELLAFADARPRIHIWPRDDGQGFDFSIGPVGRRFEGMASRPDTCALAVGALEDQLANGGVLILERASTATFGEDE